MIISDGDLIGGYLDGKPSAVAVVDGWLAAASASFRRHLGADGEDLLQELRMEALRLLRAGQFRGESSLKTFLWRAATCTCIDALRRRRRAPALATVDEEPPSGQPSPLDLVLRQEQHARRLAVLGSLSAECRELWTLILQGLGYQEIGRRTGTSESALRVRAYRCRKRALELLAVETPAPASYGSPPRTNGAQ